MKQPALGLKMLKDKTRSMDCLVLMNTREDLRGLVFTFILQGQ